MWSSSSTPTWCDTWLRLSSLVAVISTNHSLLRRLPAPKYRRWRRMHSWRLDSLWSWRSKMCTLTASPSSRCRCLRTTISSNPLTLRVKCRRKPKRTSCWDLTPQRSTDRHASTSTRSRPAYKRPVMTWVFSAPRKRSQKPAPSSPWFKILKTSAL